MTIEEIKRINNIPEDLKQSGLFCLWRREVRDGRLTKVPYNPHRPQSKAMTNKPETFASFSETITTLEARASEFDGMGILVRDFVGIDIDHVAMDEAGHLIGAAADIMESVDTYTEYSPSGSGLRMFCSAPGIEFDKSKFYIKHGNLEIYIPGYTNRFLTVTGNAIRKTSVTADQTWSLSNVLDKYMKKPKNTDPDRESDRTREPLDMTEAELITKAMDAENGHKFADLFRGNWESYYSSQSEADFGFCCMLAFWTQKDIDMMDSIFRKSELYREKWEREDYRETTLKNAIGLTSETYSPSMKTATQSESVVNKSENTSKQDVSSKPEEGKTDPVRQESQLTSLEDFAEFMKEIQSDRFEPISTGIDQLDKALSGGLERKTLVTLAAAPGAGKTAIAQYLLENMAEKGHNVVYVNLEMDRSQLLSRSIARLSHEASVKLEKSTPHVKNHISQTPYADIFATNVRRGYEWTDVQRTIVEKTAADYIAKIAPHFQYVTTNPENRGSIKDNKLSSIMDKLEAITAELISKEPDEAKKKHAAPLVCIDYLQFVKYDLTGDDEKKPDNAEAIKQTLDTFKKFAMKYNTVVILITANNRASNAEGRASMDSARDTSNIEYSGDVMLSLVYTAVEERWTHKTNKKDRDGNTKRKLVDNDYINATIDLARKEDRDYPMIAKRVSLKVVKGRSIASRGAAKFIYDGRYFYFEPDTDTIPDEYKAQSPDDTE